MNGLSGEKPQRVSQQKNLTRFGKILTYTMVFTNKKFSDEITEPTTTCLHRRNVVVARSEGFAADKFLF
jgi:hypothetical protein